MHSGPQQNARKYWKGFSKKYSTFCHKNEMITIKYEMKLPNWKRSYVRFRNQHNPGVRNFEKVVRCAVNRVSNPGAPSTTSGPGAGNFLSETPGDARAILFFITINVCKQNFFEKTLCYKISDICNPWGIRGRGIFSARTPGGSTRRQHEI